MALKGSAAKFLRMCHGPHIVYVFLIDSSTLREFLVDQVGDKIFACLPPDVSRLLNGFRCVVLWR